MTFFKAILFVLFFLNMNSIYAQNIGSYKWKNRLLLVLTDDTDNAIYKKQIKEFRINKNGLEERKLIVYNIKKDNYKIGLTENIDWQNSTKLYKAYKKTNTTFEILLIGLDGDMKLRKNTFLNCKDLFSIIDVMPMRKSEINNN